MGAAQVAKRLIQKKGASVVFRHFGEQVVASGGASVEREASDLVTRCVLLSFSAGRINGTTIRGGDKEGLMDNLSQAGLEPVVGDELFYGPAVAKLRAGAAQGLVDSALEDPGTKRMRVEDPGPIFDGDSPAAYQLHLRG